MQPGYRGYPQQMPPQRSPHGLAPNARRVPAPGTMMAPGVAHHQMAAMAPGMQVGPQHHYAPAPGPPGAPGPAPGPPTPQHPQQHQQHHPQQHQQPPPPHMAQHPHAVAPMPLTAVAPMGHPGAAMHHMAHHPQQAVLLQQQQQQHAQHGPPHGQHAVMTQHHQQQQQQHAAAAAAAAAQAQQAQHHANEAAKRRSRKPTDKTLPDGVEDVIVGDGVQRYRELRDFERRLDATLTRKRLDIVDSVHRNLQKRYKTLRIWISNTVENQPWQTGQGGPDNFNYATTAEATYRVKIEGRLLDEEDEEDEEEKEKEQDAKDTNKDDAMDTDTETTTKTKTKAKPPKYHLTHFFQAMTVEYDKAKKGKTATATATGAAPATSTENNGPKPVEWKRAERPAPPPQPGMAPPPPVPAAEFDELTFQRAGDATQNVTIQLFRSEEPERFLLDEALADVVDMDEATRAEAVMGLFAYVRLQHLQEDEEKRNFRCDDKLRRLVGQDMGFIPMLHDYVNAHIRPLPPVRLPYTIRVDEAFHKSGSPPTIYDVRVALDDPLRAQLRPFVQSPAYLGLLRDVAVLDDQLAVLVQAIALSKSKHEFLHGLAKDPAAFVRQWLSSQKRDLDVIMGESVRAASAGSTVGSIGTVDGHRASDSAPTNLWKSQNARESVNLLLAKQPLIPRGH